MDGWSMLLFDASQEAAPRDDDNANANANTPRANGEMRWGEGIEAHGTRGLHVCVLIREWTE
jgi:hypothetical protein